MLNDEEQVLKKFIYCRLQQESLFGKGIYLSSELGVSIAFSPVGYGWGGSILGSDMSCVALCEVIDHPDVKIGGTGKIIFVFLSF